MVIKEKINILFVPGDSLRLLNRIIYRLRYKPLNENLQLGINFIESVVKVNLPFLLKPETCVLNLTSRCNLKCKMCTWYTKKINELTTEQWKNIIRDLKNDGFKHAVFMGGETFLRKDWHEIAKYSQSIGFTNSLTTNGTLIDRYLDKIHVFNAITFSIDSLKIHDKIRGVNGAFKKAITNMRLVRDMGYPININTVIQKDNYEEIPSLVKFAEKENVTLNLIYPMINAFDETVSNNNEILNFDFDKLKSLFYDAVKHTVVINSKEFYDFCIRATFQDVKRSCLAPRLMINIQPDGRVFTCCGNLPSVGNLSTSKFNDIYNSRLYGEIRKKKPLMDQ